VCTDATCLTAAHPSSGTSVVSIKYEEHSLVGTFSLRGTVVGRLAEALSAWKLAPVPFARSLTNLQLTRETGPLPATSVETLSNLGLATKEGPKYLGSTLLYLNISGKHDPASIKLWSVAFVRKSSQHINFSDFCESHLVLAPKLLPERVFARLCHSPRY
jgi:hypothetical protein